MLLTRMLFVDDDIDVKFRRQITVKTEVGEFVLPENERIQLDEIYFLLTFL